MNIQNIVQSLKKYAQGGPAPALPLPDSIMSVVLEFPEETAEYVLHRVTHIFEDKAEVGKHLDDFSDLTGLSRHQLVTLNTNLGLRTNPYKSVRQRKNRVRGIYETRHKILEALTEVIKGYGSVPQIAKKYDLTPRQIYGLAGTVGRQRGFTLYDLKHRNTSERLALAMDIQRQVGAEIDEIYKDQIE